MPTILPRVFRRSPGVPILAKKALFNRALQREFAMTGMALLLVLMCIMLATRGAKLFSLAAEGAVALDAVSTLLGFSTLAVIPWLLTITVFLTVLMVLNRAWRDHEMHAWQSAGLSLGTWIKPVMRFAVPLGVVAALLSLIATPWTNQKSREYVEQLATREDLSSIAPGVFKESSKSDRVYFIENFSVQSGAARNIFVQSQLGKVQSIIVSAEGKLHVNSDGERILVLKNGRRYESILASNAAASGILIPNIGASNAVHDSHRVIEFGEAALRLNDPQPIVATETAAKSTFRLLQDGDKKDLAEFNARIAIPIAAILLALLAIPLSFINPRVGRAFNFFVAILLFVIYLNLISLMQTWISTGQLSPKIGMWPLHFAVAMLVWSLFRWRAKPRG